MARMQAVLSQFQAAQTEMAQQHDAGMLDHSMAANSLPGGYGDMARGVNQLVKSHTTLMMRLVELYTINPARVMKLDKGRLAAGSAADVTIFDPESMWTYDVNKSMSKSRNSPFDGHRFRGGPVTTIVNGVVVWNR